MRLDGATAPRAALVRLGAIASPLPSVGRSLPRAQPLRRRPSLPEARRARACLQIRHAEPAANQRAAVRAPPRMREASPPAPPVLQAHFLQGARRGLRFPGPPGRGPICARPGVLPRSARGRCRLSADGACRGLLSRPCRAARPPVRLPSARSAVCQAPEPLDGVRGRVWSSSLRLSAPTRQPPAGGKGLAPRGREPQGARSSARPLRLAVGRAGRVSERRKGPSRATPWAPEPRSAPWRFCSPRRFLERSFRAQLRPRGPRGPLARGRSCSEPAPAGLRNGGPGGAALRRASRPPHLRPPPTYTQLVSKGNGEQHSGEGGGAARQALE